MVGHIPSAYWFYLLAQMTGYGGSLTTEAAQRMGR